MDVRIEQSWKSQLAAEWDKQYFINLTGFVREQYSTRTVFPLCGFSRLNVSYGNIISIIVKVKSYQIF